MGFHASPCLLRLRWLLLRYSSAAWCQRWLRQQRRRPRRAIRTPDVYGLHASFDCHLSVEMPSPDGNLYEYRPCGPIAPCFRARPPRPNARRRCLSPKRSCRPGGCWRTFVARSPAPCSPTPTPCAAQPRTAGPGRRLPEPVPLWPVPSGRAHGLGAPRRGPCRQPQPRRAPASIPAPGRRQTGACPGPPRQGLRAGGVARGLATGRRLRRRPLLRPELSAAGRTEPARLRLCAALARRLCSPSRGNCA